MEGTIGKILQDAVLKHRRANKLSYAKMQALCGVNGSTICRIEKGQTTKIDADVICRLAAYLNLPVESVIQNVHGAPVSYFPDKPTPDVVAGFLAQDESLSPISRRVLDGIFRAAYGEYVAYEGV